MDKNDIINSSNRTIVSLSLNDGELKQLVRVMDILGTANRTQTLKQAVQILLNEHPFISSKLEKIDGGAMTDPSELKRKYRNNMLSLRNRVMELSTEILETKDLERRKVIKNEMIDCKFAISLAIEARKEDYALNEILEYIDRLKMKLAERDIKIKELNLDIKEKLADHTRLLAIVDRL